MYANDLFYIFLNFGKCHAQDEIQPQLVANFSFYVFSACFGKGLWRLLPPSAP
jgi:hypothetical protein